MVTLAIGSSSLSGPSLTTPVTPIWAQFASPSVELGLYLPDGEPGTGVRVGVVSGEMATGMGVGVGTSVLVGGGGGGNGVFVGGRGVADGGIGVSVGVGFSVGTGVLVARGVFVGVEVSVGVGTGVAVGGIGVFVKVGRAVLVGRAVDIWATGVLVTQARDKVISRYPTHSRGLVIG